MNWFTALVAITMLLPCSCSNAKNKNAHEKMIDSLNRKEQRLLQKEQFLMLKEEELSKREARLDSTSENDTTLVQNPVLAGSWRVEMTCIETTCAESAVGDTKTEEWDIYYQNNVIVAKAKSNNEVIRTYTGLNTGSTIELAEDRASIDPKLSDTKMVVRLRLIDDNNMDGQREIVREGDCKVVYSLKLKKDKR